MNSRADTYMTNVPSVKPLQKIIFINSMDSFAYNLVHDICHLANVDLKVVSNNIPIESILQFNPAKIIISPGPGHPKYDSGNIIPIIKTLHEKCPILGVCLGYQAMCEAFGELDEKKGSKPREFVGRAKVGPMHGKISRIFHTGEDIFKDVPNPLEVIRYHSLSAKSELFPSSLEITAMATDGTIMALKHKHYPIYGVQFHPESISMRPFGLYILRNFLEI